MHIYIYIYALYIYIYIYLYQINLRTAAVSLFESSSAKDQSAQTTTRAVGIAYRLWLPFSINRVLNLTKLRSIISYIISYIISLYHIYINLKSGREELHGKVSRKSDIDKFVFNQSHPNS